MVVWLGVCRAENVSAVALEMRSNAPDFSLNMSAMRF